MAAKKKNFTTLESMLKKKISSGFIPALQLCVMQHGESVFSTALGNIANKTQKVKISAKTIFDATTLTKLFTASAFMHFCEMDKINLDDLVVSIFPEFQGYRPIRPFVGRRSPDNAVDISRGNHEPVDSLKITFRQLLSNNSGLPAWLPLYDNVDIFAARDAAMHTHFCYQSGKDVLKSDLAYLLLGWAVEDLNGTDLSTAIDNLVIRPLGLKETGFRPTNPATMVPLPMPKDGVAPSGLCDNQYGSAIGESLDKNTTFFNGITGHAGIFSTTEDLANFGNAFINGSAFLKAESIFAMTHSQCVSFDGKVNMGLGFQLWSDDENASFSALSSEAFGMDACAGSALWIDPQRELVIALLNSGCQCIERREKLEEARQEIIREVVDVLG